MDLVVDLRSAPDWVFQKYPGCFSVDSTGRKYEKALSMFHKEANVAALGFLRNVSEHLAKKFEGCMVGIQPTYNNEYEAKFTQVGGRA